MNKVDHARRVIVKDTGIAGNVGITKTVPAGCRWRILSIRIVLTTNATAGDRTARATFRDSAATYIVNIGHGIQAVSLTISYHWFPSAPYSSIPVTAPLPNPSILDASEDVYLYISGGLAGDSYTYIITYLEWKP